MTDTPSTRSASIVERLRDVSIYLEDAIAGYRDDDLKRAARGCVDIARTTQEAADEIERLRALAPIVREQGLEMLDLRAEIEQLRAALREIADMPATLEAKIDVARRALEPMP